jgi:hypothetical protein
MDCFGKRSERLAALVAEQLALELGNLETGVAPPAAANDDAPAAKPLGKPPRKKARRNIGALPKHLPRCEQVLEPEATACPCSQGQLHKIGEDVGEVLDVIPAILRRHQVPQTAWSYHAGHSWVCGRFGTPGIIGKTGCLRSSEQHQGKRTSRLVFSAERADRSLVDLIPCRASRAHGLGRGPPFCRPRGKSDRPFRSGQPSASTWPRRTRCPQRR